MPNFSGEFFITLQIEMKYLFVVVGNFSPYLFVGSPICHTFTASVINRTSQATGLSYFLAWGINSCCYFLFIWKQSLKSDYICRNVSQNADWRISPLKGTELRAFGCKQGLQMALSWHFWSKLAFEERLIDVCPLILTMGCLLAIELKW